MSPFPHVTEALRPLISQGWLSAGSWKAKPCLACGRCLTTLHWIWRVFSSKEWTKGFFLPHNSGDVLCSLACFMFYLSEHDLWFIDKDNQVTVTRPLLEELGRVEPWDCGKMVLDSFNAPSACEWRTGWSQSFSLVELKSLKNDRLNCIWLFSCLLVPESSVGESNLFSTFPRRDICFTCPGRLLGTYSSSPWQRGWVFLTWSQCGRSKGPHVILEGF